MSQDDLLKYSTHDFGLLCYGGVSNVWLVYAGSPHKVLEDRVAREKTPADKERFPGFKSGSYKAFAGPMEMTWRSRDGSELSHTIDLNKEVPDRTIQYDHPERVQRSKPFETGEPTVIVEFNDRTVNVYIAVTLHVSPLDPAKRTVDYDVSYTCVYSRTL
ncbi:hypothetical protein [Massilia pseudoviolaceinigra]|uniref:hypothetical protein n=1 Tax=Massilia pseudoviolaceinigra TaxID=3057165 RepID=UPI002796DF69|nr:hypothetical protein [Massilia sp. CCM 9206]MDQ1925130.1 hypothetical protein [Massilia sp. CCM 9206]